MAKPGQPFDEEELRLIEISEEANYRARKRIRKEDEEAAALAKKKAEDDAAEAAAANPPKKKFKIL